MIDRYGAEQDTAEAVGLYDFAVIQLINFLIGLLVATQHCHKYLNLKTRMHSLCVKQLL